MVFSCIYSGNQLSDVVWTLDGSSDFLNYVDVSATGITFPGAFPETFSNSILSIENIDLRFTGEIGCSVADIDGNSTQDAFNLTV